MKKHEDASRQGCGWLGEDESKAGERRPTGWISLPVQSNERKMSSRCLRRDSSNYPPSSGAVPLGCGACILHHRAECAVSRLLSSSPSRNVGYSYRVGLSQLLPFMLAAMMIALIAARRHALLAEQEVQVHADELEQANYRRGVSGCR